MVRRIARYGVVGSVAAVVYYLSAIALVELGSLHPLAANPVAFVIAFAVNYTGQRTWTFADSARPHRSSLPRFLLVAMVSFTLNQTLFGLLLAHTPLPYQVALPIAAGSVAALSFMLSLLWAFRSASRLPAPLSGAGRAPLRARPG